MHYAEVLVAEASYHGQEALTYQSEKPLVRGAVVVVPLRARQVLGVVIATTQRRPKFVTKNIIAAPAIPPLPAELLSLMQWIHQYYPGPWGVVAQHFLPRQLPKKPLEALRPQPPIFGNLPPLTAEQTAAGQLIQSPGMHLLHGETGSGKTRVYIELARQALASQRASIILTPEIGLTSQLAADFRAVFGSRVVVIHSRLTEATRQRIWLQLLEAQHEPLIVIGPRSALFSPLANIGLIVVDEAHETAYKQDQAPYYHASRVASKLAELHKATAVLGSATPLVQDYFVAEQKGRPIVRMQKTARATAQDFEHKVTVVDLRDRKQFSRNSHFSDALIASIEATLARHEQVLLFLNRRGTARVVFCEQCGWQATCPHCDLPLVYHGDNHLMRCHSCEFKMATPGGCPECHSAAIVFKTIGTKAITDEAAHLFPEAKVQRFDTDNKQAERIEQHYDAVRSGGVDIIVGTQMLAKGLDLPKLGLVGVMIADTSLYFPDYSSQERTYQLLSQVLGRVGRGHRSTQAIVQTYAPDNPTLQAVLNKDWDTFYNKELQERRDYLFPPFCYLLKLSCRRASAAASQTAAKKLAADLQQHYPRLKIEGPAPSFREKVQDKYQWQLIVKARRRSDLLAIIAALPSNWSYDIDPLNLL